jgi:hypothetical protein
MRKDVRESHPAARSRGPHGRVDAEPLPRPAPTASRSAKRTGCRSRCRSRPTQSAGAEPRWSSCGSSHRPVEAGQQMPKPADLSVTGLRPRHVLTRSYPCQAGRVGRSPTPGQTSGVSNRRIGSVDAGGELPAVAHRQRDGALVPVDCEVAVVEVDHRDARAHEP